MCINEMRRSTRNRAIYYNHNDNITTINKTADEKQQIDLEQSDGGGTVVSKTV